MNTTDKILEELDVLIEDSLRNSKPIGAIFCDARRTIANYRARIAEFWDALETVRGQLSAAKREAEYLATSIHRAEYSNVAPNWELCDSVAGVISQIDNMYAGVRAQRDELRRWTSVNGVIDLERERDRGLKENRDLWSSNAELTEQRDRLAEALKLCRQRVVGECGFYWENTTYTYKSRDYIADVCEQALQYLNKNES